MENLILYPFGMIAAGTLFLVFTVWAIKTVVRTLFWCACLALLIVLVYNQRPQLESLWKNFTHGATTAIQQLQK